MSATAWPAASCQGHLEGAATSFVTINHLNIIIATATRTQQCDGIFINHHSNT